MKKLLIIFLLLLSVGGFAQTVTEVFYPRYISGVGSGDVAADRKVPYACRMTLSGLIPNRLYYYFNRFVQDPVSTDPGVIDGQGNIILAKQGGAAFQRITAPSLDDSATSGAFTTDAAGNYTGWFVTEPSASNVYFPGNQLYWRIMLRNASFSPGNAVELRLTSTNTVTVLNWLNYDPYPGVLAAPPGFTGTGVTITADADYVAKNFVMLYDNLAGTGRPLSGTFIEVDGADESTANGYIAFYNALNNTAGRFGAVIPSGSPQGPGLANGVRNISQYALSNGNIVNVCTNATGFTGTVNHAGTAQNGLPTVNISTCTTPTSCNNLSLSLSSTGTNCDGNTGSIDLTVTGGTAPYTYSWSNGATTEDITGLAAGTYTVTVTDASGVCTAVASATISAVQPSLSTVVTNVGCNGGSNGAINLTVTGPGAPFTYSWSNGATTEDISGLAAGTYTVTVTGTGSCTATTSAVVSQPTTLVASSSATPIPNCGGPTTTVSVSASGGTPPYSGTGTFTVGSGPYSFTVTDANGCTAVTSGTVAPATCITITEVYYPRYVQGVGSGSDANDARVPYACRMTIGGLNPGATYRFYSRFVDNPSSTSNGAGQYILVNQTGNFTRVTSASLSTVGSYGELTANGSGSYTGWFVVEPGSDNIFQPGNQLYWRIILNDGAGSGSVASRITATNPVSVITWGTTPADGSAIHNVANAALTAKNFIMLYDNLAGTGRPVTGTFIESDGTANTTTEFYNFFYETNVDGQDKVWGTIIPNNLGNGINNISQYALSDGSFINKCTSPNGVYGATDTRNATAGGDPFGDPPLVIDCTPTAGCNITLSTTQTNVACFGASTGAINLTVNGATAPITYSWSNGATTEDLSGIPAGTYTVTVTDAASCTATATVTITQPAQLVASESHTAILCFGGTSTVTISATGGTAPYTGTGTFTQSAGTQSYTVTDANGCTSSVSVIVTQPAQLVASESHTAILCFGGTSTVTISATGGTAPYTGTGTFTQSAGTQSYTVTDANGCTSAVSVTVTQPAQLVASESHTAILCFGGTSTVTISATGGTAPYTGTGTFTQSAGTQSYTVTDANGCTSSVSVIVTQPAQLVASESHTAILCFGGTSTVTISATGGTAPYTGTGTFTQSAGTQSYTVTDANGCTSAVSVTVTQPAQLVASESHTAILCFGGTSTVTISATGGTAPYTGTGTFTQSAGTQSYTVTDANGCTSAVSVTVTQPAQLVASESHTAILCFGGTSTVTISATGGTAPYTGTGTFTQSAGTQSYTVTDANGCTSSVSVTVTQPAQLVASESHTAILCFGGTSTVTISATGGTAPYTGTGTFTQSAGTQSYTVTDANGCTSSVSVTVTQPAQLVASESHTAILCFGGTSTVTISATGGTAPYTGTGTFTQSAGTQSYTVTDANGCTSSVSVTVTQPAQLVASESHTAILCFGGTSTVTISATGGTAPYTGTGTFTQSAGTQSYTVTDANGCTSSVSVTVTQPSQLSVSATSTPVTTTGGSDGTATASVSGGTPPYSYLWSPGGQTTATATGLTAGSYTVTVTDANGCTASATTTVGSPSCNITLSFTQTNVSCNGGSNGTATVTASGTIGSVSYSWSNGQTTATATGLAAGTYTVTVTDGAGCTASGSVTITQPAQLVASESHTSIACFGGTSTVTISATGGTAPYTGTGTFTQSAGTQSYTVTDANGCTSSVSVTVTQPAQLVASESHTAILCFGGTSTVTISATGGTAPYTGTGTFTQSAGTQSYTVTDANGCTSSVSVTVTQPSQLVASESHTAILCFGGTSTVTISATGGTAPYTGTGTFTQSAGTQSYTVTDANGCTSSVSVTVTQPAQLVASESHTAILCFGGTSTVTISATGGTAPYTGTGTFTQSAGTQSYTVTDANGCTSSVSVTVTQPAQLVASESHTAILCFGGTSTVTISATGGTAPYTGTGTFTQSAGTQSYTVTDANGCTSSVSVTVTQPSQLSVSATSTPVTTTGGSDGTATASVSGGTPPYSYLWSPGGQTTATATGLTAGSYTVTVTDANGCTASATTTVGSPSCNITLSFTQTNVSCNGGSNGTATVTASGTIGSVSYSWSNGQTTQTATGLAAGSYTVTVTDGAGCTASGSVTITQPAQLVASESHTSIACFGGTSTVTISATGGTAPYTGTGTFTQSAGTQSYTVTDANGCTSSVSVTVTQPSQLSVSATSTPVTTSGGSDGTATASVSGGTPPYSYLWSPGGQTTATATGLTAGSYTVTVTDANGCTASATTTVGSPSCNITLSFTQTNVSCNGGSNGTATVTASGTSGSVSYSWSNGQTTQTATGLAAGSYTVTVTDGAGCTASGSVTITQPASALTASAVATGLSCTGTTNDGSVNLTVSGGTSPYIYLWSNGATTEDLSGLAPGTYSVTVTDANGCTATASATVAARLVASSSVAPVACNDQTGQVTVTATGGLPPYTGTGTFTVPAGNYSFTVTDAAGCSKTTTGRVISPLVASSSAGTIPCGGTTTTVIVTASQGVGPYTGTGTFTVGAGPYSFTVTDSRGCTATTSGTIASPACYTVSEVYYPRYVQGVGSGSPSDDVKVPYAARMTIGGLTPGATYRYYSRFTDNPGSLSNGIGSYILVNQSGNFTRVTSASLSTAGSYGEFTADGSGNFTGWFVAEPGSDIGFQPGNQLYWRIVLNDGAGGSSVAARITAANPVTVLGFGSTPTEGTGLRSTASSSLTAKNFIMLYNNVAGTGRPESGTFIESDGTVNSEANGFAPFYANSVDGTDKTWGSIIPNNLSNGINNITQYALTDGSFVSKCTSPTGVYGGTATANANGGLTELVISTCNDATVCNLTLSTVVTNVSCNGGENGAINLTVNGANGTVSYSWSNGSTTEDISGLTAGTYTVTVTETANPTCTATVTVTVTQPTALSVSATSTPVTTSGGSDGTATASVSGGTPPYSYLWSPGGQTTATATGLTAGSYTVTVTDANGCTASATTTVGSPSCNITLSFTQTNVSCNGGSNGTATVTASGTIGSVSYSWSNGQTTQTATGLAAGSYTVTVTDGAGCTASGSVTITQPASALTASAVATGLSCTGTTNDGSVNLTVSGGTSPYIYLWSNGATTEDLSGLAPGTYSVTVTDANGCTATASATVAARLVASSSVAPVACNDQTGQVTVTATGGLPPYTGTGTFTVPAGNYSFTVTDAAGCSKTTTGRVISPLVASSSAGTIPCGGTTTTVIVTASQGVGPYTGTGTFTVGAGPYSFTVTDSRGCTATTSGTIASPACYTVSEVYYPRYVQGVGSGSPSDDVKVPYAARMTIGGLTPGATYRYYSRFTDNPGSLSNGIGSYILVNQSGNFTRVTSASLSTAGSYGEFTADGSGNFTGWFVAEPGSDIGFQPGNQLYWRIVLNDGAGGSSVAARITAANPVTVLGFGSTPTEGTGLRSTASSSLTAKNFIMLYNNVAGTGRPESGTFIESDGTVNSEANGFAPFYANSVDGTDKTWGSIIPNNLSNGINNITQYALTDGSFVSKCTSPTGVYGGTATANANGGLTELVISTCNDATVCNLTLSTVVTNVSCNGGENGAINLTVNGANGTVSYSWSNGSTTEDISGLTAGTYTVTVTETANPTCTATVTVTVTQPTALVASSSAGTIACNGGTTTVTVSATGGTAPYTGTGTFTRGAGTYSFTVTDAHGCTSVTTITITQPAELVASSTAGTIACHGGTTTVTVTATGGTAPYTGTGTFTRGAGTYSFTVTDANGCTSVTTITITQPAELVASSTAGTIACHGGTTTVTVTATGGTAPYTGTGTFTRGAGTHSFTVTDASGCTSVTTITITQPTALTATATSTPATSGSNGTATANPSGGTAPYTYLWSPGGQTTQTATGLAAGTYTVTVTDSRGCTTTATTTVAAGGCNLLVNAGPDKTICNNSSSVTLTASVTGVSAGTPPATPFTEVSGSTAEMRLFSGNIDHITIGNTFSQSEDRNNCNKNSTSAKTLTLPAGAVVKKVYLFWSGSGSLDNQVKINGTSVTADGTKTATRSGGFSYFAARKDVTSLVTTSGTYTVSELNWNNGSPYCYDNSAYGAWAMTVIYEKTSLPSVRIHVNTEKFVFTYPAGTYSTTINNVSVPAGCSANAQLTIVAFEGDSYKGERYRIAGVLDADSNNFRGQAGPNLDIITKNAPSIVGGTTSLTYSIESYVSNTPFGQAIEGLFDYVKVLKYNNCPANTCNVAYLWTRNGTTVGTSQSITVSTAGTYTVSATDCANCIATDDVVVTLSNLAASSTAGTINCNGGTTTVTVSATGGTAPYTGTGTFTKGAGTWSFTVTDSKGCTAVTSVTITQPALLVATASAPAIPCGGSTTTVTVSASGGTAPYTGTGTFTKGPGTWSFTVTDAKSCSKVATITIAQPVCDPCFKVIARHSGKALTIAGGSTANGGLAEQRTYTGAANQIWKAIEVESGYVRIINFNSDKSLEVAGASTASGANIQQNAYTGGNHQKWSINSSGSYIVAKAKHSGKAASVAGSSTADGARVEQRGNGNSHNEQWTVTEVGCPVYTKNYQPVVVPEEENIMAELTVTVQPNPSISNFSLTVRSNDNTTPVSVKILDAYGKVISVHQKVGVNSTLKIGSDNWTGGIYFAEVTQGGERKVVKMVKVN